ncbi:hypothetical protein BHE74_00032174, partial [Ensete ventricosum]
SSILSSDKSQDSPTHRVGPTIRATFFASHKAGSPVGKATLKATTLAPRGLFFFFLSSFLFRSVPSSDPDFHEWAVIDGLGLRTNGSATNGQNSAGLKLLIGGLLGRLCEDRGIPFAFGSGRLENRAKLEADIAAAALTHVFNAAGATCRPNVDWCEDDRVDVETIRANVVGTLTLGDVCRERGLLLVNCASGCIFEYDGAHTLGSGAGFKEEHTPNFVGSFCSKTKAMVIGDNLQMIGDNFQMKGTAVRCKLSKGFGHRREAHKGDVVAGSRGTGAEEAMLAARKLLVEGREAVGDHHVLTVNPLLYVDGCAIRSERDNISHGCERRVEEPMVWWSRKLLVEGRLLSSDNEKRVFSW